LCNRGNRWGWEKRVKRGTGLSGDPEKTMGEIFTKPRNQLWAVRVDVANREEARNTL